MRNMTRDKVRGMFVGGAIGDALGMGVETWTPEKIFEVHPQGITGYLPPVGHKWFTPEAMPAGTTTDDTQLTLATAQGLIEGHSEAVKQKNFAPYMDGIAKAHVEASKASIAGWGKSTVEACRRLANGVNWSISGKTTEANRGTGNGVPMKCSPLAVWYASKPGREFEEDGKDILFNQKIVNYSAMTHWSSISAQAAVVHTNAVWMCLFETPDTFVMKYFFDMIYCCLSEWTTSPDEAEHNFYSTAHLDQSKDDIGTPLSKLQELWFSGKLKKMTVAELRDTFGGGSCYVYDSLPFAYAWFVRNSLSVDTLRQVCEAGGDTDTNAKMVGEMIGALNGLSFFQTPENKWMIEGLPSYNSVVAAADQLCDTLGIS